MQFSKLKATPKSMILTLLFALLTVSPVFAQEAEASSMNLETLLIIVLSFVLIVAILILVIGLYLVSIIRMILLESKKQEAAAEGKEYVQEVQKSWISKVVSKASRCGANRKRRNNTVGPQLRRHQRTRQSFAALVEVGLLLYHCLECCVSAGFSCIRCATSDD
jgi:phosphate/sulfate permease